ncbi:DNA-binding protein [bacterium]|nr:DNA-binding protein [bacterium]
MLESQHSELSTIGDDEGYHIDVNEVAQMLGVTRTRVSQLTSTGQLSFERRRVGVRNRLFYKRSEVLAYQRGYYGRHIPTHINVGGARDSQHLSLQDNSNPQSVQQHSLDSRRGAVAIEANGRSTWLVPEAILQETSRLAQQENHNSLVLSKVLETVSKIAGELAKKSRPTLPPATAQLAATAEIERIDNLHQMLQHIARRLDLQSHEINRLNETLATLRKDIFQVQTQQQKTSAELRTVVCRSTPTAEISNNQIQHSEPHQRRLSPVASRSRLGRTAPLKRISRR